MDKISKETNGSFTEVFKSIFGDQREAGKKPNYEGAQKDAEVKLLTVLKKRNRK